MYEETDLIALLHDLPEHHLRRGDVGTVAYVYEIDPNENGHLYEVEFINAAGDREAWAFIALQTLDDATPNCKLGLAGATHNCKLGLAGALLKTIIVQVPNIK